MCEIINPKWVVFTRDVNSTKSAITKTILIALLFSQRLADKSSIWKGDQARGNHLLFSYFYANSVPNTFSKKKKNLDLYYCFYKEQAINGLQLKPSRLMLDSKYSLLDLKMTMIFMRKGASSEKDSYASTGCCHQLTISSIIYWTEKKWETKKTMLTIRKKRKS